MRTNPGRLGIVRLCAAALAVLSLGMARPAHGGRNLVPDKAGDSPGYWSTWAAQNYTAGQGLKGIDWRRLTGGEGAGLARANLNEKLLFGPGGWATMFPADVRSGLYLLLADGWDVPPDGQPDRYGLVIPDAERFPSCTGAPAERLRTLNQKAKAAGWRGIGLWIHAGEAMDPMALGPEVTVAFDPAQGRYIRLVALSEVSDNPWASAAEINLIGPDGKRLPRDKWKIHRVSSEEKSAGEQAANVLDGKPDTHWHTQWQGANPGHPHEIEIDLGQTQRFKGLVYMPREGGGNGTIKDYALYVSADAKSWGKPVAKGDFFKAQDNEGPYWRARLKWCNEAGIEYWQVGWGPKGRSLGFRRMLTELARTEAPKLVIEHAATFPAAWQARCAAFSDVLGLGDVCSQLSVPQTLAGIAALSQGAKLEPPARGLLDCGDEPYVAAVLGLAIGATRHPLLGQRTDSEGGDVDLYFPGPRQAKKRQDALLRAVRWQRLAPAMGQAKAPAAVDSRKLQDAWAVKRSWDRSLLDRTVEQSAPARIARGLPLPDVKAEGEPPFVIASAGPNGAVAVGTLGRTSVDKGWFAPEADVTVQVGQPAGPVGVFGHFRSLTLVFDKPLGKPRVWGQDLAGRGAADVSDNVKVEGNRLTLPGALIDKVGLSAAAKGDLSDPGAVFVLEKAR